MMDKAMNDGKELEVKKLLNNSTRYVSENRIEKTINGYIVSGDHGNYVVDGNCQCNCPMSKRQGKYNNVQDQKCSHVQAVEIYKKMHDNIILLEGEPGSGKSYCVKKIISNHNGKSKSIMVKDMTSNGCRTSFRIVLRKNEKIFKKKTFAKKYQDEKFNKRIGSWFIRSEIFDKYAVPYIQKMINKIKKIRNDEKYLFIIDELGLMQTTSDKYIEVIDTLIRTIQENSHKKFKTLFIVPTNNIKYPGLDVLKNKYETFIIHKKTRNEDQEKIINYFLYLK